MTKKKRRVLVVVGIVALLLGAEIALNIWRGSQACIEITNQGSTPIEDLVITLGSRRVSVPKIAPQASTRVYLTGRTTGTLLMTFHQDGNPLGTYQVPNFDPVSLNSEGFKLILNVRMNEIEKYQDDADPATPLGQLWKAFWDSFTKAVELPR